MATLTIEREVALAEAKDRLSALTAQANTTGTPFVITRNRKPWVEVRPLAARTEQPSSITITPARRKVAVPDLDILFEGFNDNSFRAEEDGFASSAGLEAM